MIPEVEKWARQLRDARNNLAHTGNEATDDNIFLLEKATTSLIALVLMAELEISAEVQQRAAHVVLRVGG